MAHDLYVVPGTVRYRWRKWSEEVTLKELVSWGILLRAMELWPLLGSWKEVADALGIDLRTLESYAERLMDASLGTLERTMPSDVLKGFKRRVLDKIAWGA